MLTATHYHALLKTKVKKLERKYYFQYVLKFDIRTSFYILKFDIHTLLNVLKVLISNSSTLNEVHISNLSTYIE